MAESWIKAHTDMLHDPKLLRLHPTSRWAWIGLLLLARSGRPVGSWKASSKQGAAEDLAIALSLLDPMENEPCPLTCRDFESMVQMQMISVNDSGLVTIVHWGDRQGDLRPSSEPDRVAVRVSKHRLYAPVTRCNAVKRDVTPRSPRSRGDLEEIKATTHPPSPLSQTAAPSDPPAKNAGAERNGFGQFWDCYPKKRKKGDALKAWTALKPDAPLLARILEAVRSQRESPDWRKAQGRYIPYPATWLRAQQWEDVLQPALSVPDELEDL